MVLTCQGLDTFFPEEPSTVYDAGLVFGCRALNSVVRGCVEMYRLFRSSQPSSQPHDQPPSQPSSQPLSQPLSGRSSITENTRNWGLDYVYKVDGHVT
jgi:hypothetical protein